MKLDILVNGQRLSSWGSCKISLDANYGANAEFLVHSAGAGPWLSNLSKVLITGRDTRPEAASWGFETPDDLLPWSVSPGLVSNGIDYTLSAYGAGSWSLTWSAPQQQVAVAQLYDLPYNMNGRIFWAWVRLDYLTTFQPQVGVVAYARDGVREWASSRLVMSSQPGIGWQACGLRLVATNTVPIAPRQVIEWGFRFDFTDAVPGNLAAAQLFTLHVDSVDLCGRPVENDLQLPPFAAGAPQGCLGPAQLHSCAKWDSFVWADEYHMQAADAGWCPVGALWDDGNKWGNAGYPAPTDVQWG